MLRGDGEKQQDLPPSPPPPHPFLSSILFYYFHRGKTNEYMASGESGRKEKADLWEDYGICVRTKWGGNMADVFCKIDYLAVRRLDCKASKTVADKKERITVLMWCFVNSSLHSYQHRVQSSLSFQWGGSGRMMFDGQHIYCFTYQFYTGCLWQLSPQITHCTHGYG